MGRTGVAARWEGGTGDAARSYPGMLGREAPVLPCSGAACTAGAVGYRRSPVLPLLPVLPPPTGARRNFPRAGTGGRAGRGGGGGGSRGRGPGTGAAQPRRPAQPRRSGGRMARDPHGEMLGRERCPGTPPPPRGGRCPGPP